jgi:hypothetical protein
MKIKIEIDGTEHALQSGPSTAPSADSAPAATTASAPLGQDSGLAEMLARAAALGAIDAGPAPAGPGESTSATEPKIYVGAGTQAVANDQSAGAAPGLDAAPRMG